MTFDTSIEYDIDFLKICLAKNILVFIFNLKILNLNWCSYEINKEIETKYIYEM